MRTKTKLPPKRGAKKKPSSDVLTPEQRASCMAHIRGRNTGPEMVLRRALTASHLRYRVRTKLPGKPDVVFLNARIAVFVDGCFWHRCPLHAVQPKTNRDFWDKKLTANVARDQRVNAELTTLGFTVLRFWEHAIADDIGAVVSTIRKHLRTHPKTACGWGLQIVNQ